MIGDRQQAVRIWRQIDPHYLGFLVRDMIDESGILVRKAIMVLSPDVRSEQIIQRSDRLTPRNLPGYLQPLRVLIEHRIDDMNEGFLAREQAMASRKQIPFEPTLAQMLAEHLHD